MNIEKREITSELKESYLDYAMSVIVSRALPDVRDGLKPVQRRILWDMWSSGLTHLAKFRKAANVIGQVLARYHPHGDISVYDALVRMAQDFSLRYPLVDGQGNFGCFTKDTKVKLTDGRSLSFGELVCENKRGKKNYTYTINRLGLVEIAEIENPRLTRKNADLVKVVLDNGQEIRCTPNHLFMMRDGSYKEAKDLLAGDSLMPLYERISEKTNRLNREGYGAAPLWATGLNKYFIGKPDLINEEIHRNHKVVRILINAGAEDVYDLTVDDTHNFALDAGIFVHNSIDGDSPAAYRYTEAKLSKIAEEALVDIEKETVEWQPNYDATRTEPKVLPAKLPNLLLNGTLGIAVGMTTSIPPHNLREVADAILYLADNHNADNEDLLRFINGPDFPTGGIIFDQKAIKEAYASGRGAITARAKAEILERKNRQFDIVVTEIPYQVNKAELIKKIAELAQDKKIEGIRDLRDESDREGLRIVIELKSDVSPQKILNQLYKHTDLQKDFHLNAIALVRGIQPQRLSIKEILAFYLDHRKEVVRRRTQFDLKRAEERAHILLGLNKALNVIDKVISTIKKSKDREDAHRNLVKIFKLSDAQTTAILEMKLQTLAALEREKISAELKEKQVLVKELGLILKSPARILKIIKDEVQELKEKYGDERRTRVVPTPLKAFKEEDLIPNEDAIITFSAGGYIKRLPPNSFRAQRRGGKGLIGSDVAEEDFLSQFFSAKTHDNLLFFTDRGRVFQTKVYEIPEASRTSKGKAIHNFLELPPQENISALVSYGEKREKSKERGYLIMATKEGLIKKTQLEEFENIRRTGIIAIALKKGDLLKWVRLSGGRDQVILATKLGQSIRFEERQIRPMGRAAAGVRAIKLKKGDEVAGFDIISGETLSLKPQNLRLVVVMENGFAKQTSLKSYKVQRRGGSGIRTAKITAKTGPLISANVVMDEKEIFALSAKGQIIRTDLKGVRTTGRSAQGVRIMNIKQGDRLAGVVII